MSSEQRHATESAVCEFRDGTCALPAPGHAMHPLRRRLAAATPSKWLDVLGGPVSTSGSVDLHGLDGSFVATVWHHELPTAALAPGEPLAFHEAYQVLAIGKRRLGVLVTAIAAG